MTSRVKEWARANPSDAVAAVLAVVFFALVIGWLVFLGGYLGPV